jgi:hypothetical protein
MFIQVGLRQFDIAETLFGKEDSFHGEHGIISGTTKRAAGPTANARLTRKFALFGKVHPASFDN